ncbi:protein Lines homolog 1 isoform X4 [Macaca thibetana thibetana]|uniref:protein Lines homolog 1 isoform X4 n=1 Tax=Macaca thibetana thibetana TaxID=257877 RepID=UPI0021BCDB71|nr:protein Lines homolog 1 isoform X4 [Macaca thibetana thibetana]
MKVFCEVLEQLYKKVLLGVTLENDSHDYIFYLNPGVSDQDCPTATSLEWANTYGIQGRHQPISVGVAPIAVAPACLKTSSLMSSSREVMLLQLTVIKVMTTRILSVKTEFHAKEKYRDIIKILLESAKVDSKLICMFQNSDKLLCHMAAQCLALLLYFQLREKITLSNSWIAFCQKNLSEYSESNKAIYCLWTLTAIIKEIFKDSCSQKTGDEVQPGCEHIASPDHVILRAASLVIMKSLEIKFQNCSSASEMKVDLQRFMSELLTFLKPHLQPSLQLHNPCKWLSRVFIEQDDDMLEAAKASLGIYLTLTRGCEATESLTQGKEMWDHHTHENGYNPHCIFLFFLKNIGFDSTVLLDFLISSETCFLEYFVRYLKLLQKDWDNFFTICNNFDATESKYDISICDCVPSLVQDQSTNRTIPHHLTAPHSHIDVCTRHSWASDAPSEPLKAMMSKGTDTMCTSSLSSPRASQSLVDYDSSDDSEVESTDQCLANSKQTSLHQQATMEIQDAAGTSRDKEEFSLEPPSRPLFLKEFDTAFSFDCEVAPNDVVSEVGIFYTIVKCFQELQDAICRLQKKNLFPYNPTALLKLLKYIEVISNKTMNTL